MIKKHSIAIIIALVFLCAMPAFASGFPTFASSYSFYEGKQHYHAIYAYADVAHTWLAKFHDEQLVLNANGCTVLQATSSNTKVMTVKVEKKYGETYIIGCTKKAGNATVNLKLSYNGEYAYYRIPVQVMKYKNPFVSLKVGSKSYASKFKKHARYDAGKDLNGKVKFKLNSRYKLRNIQKLTWDGKVLSTYSKSGANIYARTNYGEMIVFSLYDTLYDYNLYCILSSIRAGKLK